MWTQYSGLAIPSADAVGRLNAQRIFYAGAATVLFGGIDKIVPPECDMENVSEDVLIEIGHLFIEVNEYFDKLHGSKKDLGN